MYHFYKRFFSFIKSVSIQFKFAIPNVIVQIGNIFKIEFDFFGLYFVVIIGIGFFRKKINYIKVKFYDGFFYLHLQPAVFTNYYLLKNKKYNYTQNVLSYIPKSTIFWLSKLQNGENISNSKLRFIFSQPALKWAWLLFLFGMLLFMIFNAKRKQRIVPILAPLPNTSVDFTKTIANLYYQERDYQNIINKKIVFFLEKIRNEYLIETAVLDDKFINRYQLKTGKKVEDISIVVKLINLQRQGGYKSIENDLVDLNTALEKIM